MTQDTLTLKLDGDSIPVAEFAAAMQHFSDLVNALSNEIVGPNSIDWDISGLEVGSAVATIKGLYEDTDQVDKVVVAYGHVGEALKEKASIPYSNAVVRPALALANLINGHVKGIALQTTYASALVSEAIPEAEIDQVKLFDYGAITGHLETVGGNRYVEMRVRENLYGYSVACYADTRFEDIARRAWRKDLTIYGSIHRDLDSGRPIEVRDITEITIATEPNQFNIRAVLGLMPYEPGQEPAEETIRRIRDNE